LAAPSDIFVSFGYIHTYTCADQEQDTPCIPLPCHPDDAALMPSFQHTSSLFELFDLSTPQGGKKKQKEIQKEEPWLRNSRLEDECGCAAPSISKLEDECGADATAPRSATTSTPPPYIQGRERWS
jgi:hypothetical protein